MRKCILFNALALLCALAISSSSFGQSVTVAPFECYPNYTSAAEMDQMAEESGGDLPFATWRSARQYAVDNSISTVNFEQALYEPGTGPYLSADWGDASGGFDIPAGMTVNGNGSVVDNSSNANNIAFATLTGNGATLTGFTFIEFTGNNTGAVGISPNITGWSIVDCNFDHCDWAGDGLLVDLGSSGSGSLTNCNFYDHIQSTGSAMTVEGSGGTLNVTNCNYSCNLRIAAGGAVKIEEAVTVNFDGCKFSGNEANASIGGAVVVRNDAVVTFDACEFTCNLTSGGTTWDGGALAIESGSTVTITDSNFVGNGGDGTSSSPVGPTDGVGDPTYGRTRYGGAIYVSSQSASVVTLIISGTTFEDNVSTSRGGALRLFDPHNTNSQITDCYFSGNESGTGGAISIESTGPPVVATQDAYLADFSDNTFSTNVPLSSTIYTEYDLLGTGNSIDGDVETSCGNGDGTSGDSPEPAFLNFTGDDFTTDLGNWTASSGTSLSISGGTMQIDHSGKGSVYRDVSSGSLNNNCAYNTTLSSNSDIVTWTFTAINATGMEGWDGSDDGMGFVLGATSSDFFDAATNGYVVTFDKGNAGQSEISYFSGGLTADANITAIATGSGTGSGNSGFSVRVTYNPSGNLWTMEYDYSSGSSSAADIDPRMDSGVNCIGPDYSISGSDATYTSTDLPYTGFAMSGSNGMTIDHYHTKVGDGCDDGAGASVGASNLPCYGCDSSPSVSTNCTDQGSIAGVLWDDGDASSADGQEDANYISGATVRLYKSDGTLVAEVTTGADGKYFFGGLEDGGYYVEFTMPAGFLDITYQDTGASETDSDVDPNTLHSPTVTISTSGDSGSNSGSTEESDGTSGAAHYTNIDAGFTTEILPVTLTVFMAEWDRCNAAISWVTESEVNNDYFIVQSSKDGRFFENVEMVEGNGTSTERNKYHIIDKNVSSGVTYYRLIQYDYDGKISTSDIIMLDDDSNCINNEIELFPNPVFDKLNIRINVGHAYDEIIVINNLGEVVKRVQTENIKLMDVSDLEPGIYFLEVKDSNSNVIMVERFIKI